MSAWRRITEKVCGTADTPGMQEIEPAVLRAIKKPKRLPKF